jgi:hypothetical protein
MTVELIANAGVLFAASRSLGGARALVVARPRRGLIDLGDREGPPRPDRAPAEEIYGSTAPSPRWIVPASVTAALVAAATARAALIFI